MFCRKCGKDNPAGTEICKYCGTEMPKKSGSGGFSDILNFESAAPAAKPDAKNIGNELELKRITDRLSSMNDRVQKQGLFSLGAVAVCLVIAIVSLCVSCSALNKAGDVDDRKSAATEAQGQENWEQSVKELEEKIKKEKEKKKNLPEDSGISKENLDKADSYLKAIDEYYKVLKETKQSDEKVKVPEVEVNGKKIESKEMTAQEIKSTIEEWLMTVKKTLDLPEVKQQNPEDEKEKDEKQFKEKKQHDA